MTGQSLELSGPSSIVQGITVGKRRWCRVRHAAHGYGTAPVHSWTGEL